MIKLNERYVVDQDGKCVGVLLDLADFQRLVRSLEEFDALRAMLGITASDDRAAVASADEASTHHHPRASDASPERLREGGGAVSLRRPISLDEFHRWETDEDGIDDLGGEGAGE